MTWKDKLEIGLKDDAPFRRDNLPDFQKADEGAAPAEDPEIERSPEEPGARAEAARESLAVKQQRRRRTGTRPRRSRPAS